MRRLIMQQSNSITLVYYTIGWQESTVPVVTPHIFFMNNPNAGKMIRANLRRPPAAPRPTATASPPARQPASPPARQPASSELLGGQKSQFIRVGGDGWFGCRERVGGLARGILRRRCLPRSSSQARAGWGDGPSRELTWKKNNGKKLFLGFIAFFLVYCLLGELLHTEKLIRLRSAIRHRGLTAVPSSSHIVIAIADVHDITRA